ncbi:MAG: hypothetical protein ACLFMT_04480 [Halobacteriales archaeon]
MKLQRPRPWHAAVVAGLFAVVARTAADADALVGTPRGVEPPVTAALGETIFDVHLAAFEMVAVLLVAALVAGLYLARPSERRGEVLRATVERKPRVGGDGGDDDGSS